MKKQFITEATRLQKLAGIITESQYKELNEAQIAFGNYFKIYSDIAQSGDLEAAHQAVIDALPDGVSLYPNFNLTPEEEKEKYADMVADTYRINRPDFTGEDEDGFWNGWRLGYVQDDIFFIKPASEALKGPNLEGRVRGNMAIITAQDNEPKAVSFLQTLGKQLGSYPSEGDYNTFELTVKEQDLQDLFNF